MDAFMFQEFLKNLQNENEETFDNELESMKKCFANGHEQREVIRITTFYEHIKPINIEEMKKKSMFFREKGNLIMRSSNGDMRHAARLYTEAIIAAPKGSEALAFAHSNRSMALMRLGYLDSAYDDCLCALEEGYPVGKRHKVLLRQAELAKDLGELVKMKKQILELENVKLATPEIEKLENLRKSLCEMEANAIEKKEESRSTEEGTEEKSLKEPFKIVKAVGQKERSMIATKPIKKGETIFIDHAFAFVCITPGAQVCNNCADTMIVPFPCVSCSGKVVYCSLKCKQDHSRVHVYECQFIEKYVDSMIDCLALRLLLEGLPEILPYLSTKRDAQSLWSECFLNKEMKSLKYIQVLQSPSSWSICKTSRTYLQACIQVTEQFIIYFKNCTKFFDCLSGTAASAKEWKIFIGALLLRHIGQYVISRNQQYVSSMNLNQLSPRVERGQLLRMLGNSCRVQNFFPKLFVCNHDCTPMFEKEFDGRNMRAVATRDIKVGEEIYDSYLGRPRLLIGSKVDRRRLLMENFYFKCKCVECEGPDKKFKEFHQFWCENSKCRKSFSPESSDEANGGLICPHCRKTQDFNYEGEKECIIMLSQSARGRVEMFNRFDDMKRKFKDYNFTKFEIMEDLIMTCLLDEPLMSCELDKLHEINGAMSEYPIEILEKGRQYELLCSSWDVIALRGKKIHVNELENLMKIMNNIETKDRKVFMKYYEDFIVPLIE